MPKCLTCGSLTLLEFSGQPECENCGTARKVEGLRKLMLEQTEASSHGVKAEPSTEPQD